IIFIANEHRLILTRSDVTFFANENPLIVNLNDVESPLLYFLKHCIFTNDFLDVSQFAPNDAVRLSSFGVKNLLNPILRCYAPPMRKADTAVRIIVLMNVAEMIVPLA